MNTVGIKYDITDLFGFTANVYAQIEDNQEIVNLIDKIETSGAGTPFSKKKRSRKTKRNALEIIF